MYVSSRHVSAQHQPHRHWPVGHLEAARHCHQHKTHGNETPYRLHSTAPASVHHMHPAAEPRYAGRPVLLPASALPPHPIQHHGPQLHAAAQALRHVVAAQQRRALRRLVVVRRVLALVALLGARLGLGSGNGSSRHGLLLGAARLALGSQLCLERCKQQRPCACQQMRRPTGQSHAMAVHASHRQRWLMPCRDL